MLIIIIVAVILIAFGISVYYEIRHQYNDKNYL